MGVTKTYWVAFGGGRSAIEVKHFKKSFNIFTDELSNQRNNSVSNSRIRRLVNSWIELIQHFTDRTMKELVEKKREMK